VWLHFPQTNNLWLFIDELLFEIRNLQQNIPLKRKCFLLVNFSQKKITAHDAPKNMHPRYSLRAPLFLPPLPPQLTFVQKHGLVLYIRGLEESFLQYWDNSKIFYLGSITSSRIF
jgi:hypothetical protein